MISRSLNHEPAPVSSLWMVIGKPIPLDAPVHKKSYFAFEE